MTFTVVIEPNPLLRLGILHLLSKTNTALKLVGYDHVQVDQLTSSQPCDLVILSISRSDELVSMVKNVERVFQPQAILLLYDSTEIPPSVHTASHLVAGCVYKHAAPEILQASAQLVLAGGRCFPSSSWFDSTQGQLLSLYEPVKWPLPAKSEAVLQPGLKPDPEHVCADIALQNKDNPVNKVTPLTDTKARTGTPTPNCNESEMLGLTPRQYEVLVLLARGYPMKTVGRHLNISVATAKAHTESLYQRLDVRNRNAAVYTAISRGATLGWASIASHHQENEHP